MCNATLHSSAWKRSESTSSSSFAMLAIQFKELSKQQLLHVNTKYSKCVREEMSIYLIFANFYFFFIFGQCRCIAWQCRLLQFPKSSVSLIIITSEVGLIQTTQQIGQRKRKKWKGSVQGRAEQSDIINWPWEMNENCMLSLRTHQHSIKTFKFTSAQSASCVILNYILRLWNVVIKISPLPVTNST